VWVHVATCSTDVAEFTQRLAERPIRKLAGLMRCYALGLTATAMAIGSSGCLAAATDEQDVRVAVNISGNVVTVDVDLHVAASAEEAWDVLTDFDHMAEIVTNLRVSRVLSRSATRVIVAQEGSASVGLLSFSFDTVREISLKPYSEMQARLIRGSMRMMEGTTRLFATPTGTGIVSHGEFIPDVWIPPVIGAAFIEAETRKQFAEMRTEMIRRKRLASPNDGAAREGDRRVSHRVTE
jgi:Polyketide cyclase / dehydrase and lipid transport